jgi:hypothetical protein
VFDHHHRNSTPTPIILLRQYFGAVQPAAMMISAGLADPQMKMEIEVTALRQLA